MTTGNGAIDLHGPLAAMWRDVYRKAGEVADARTRELLKQHVYVYPHGAGGGGAFAGLPRCSARLKWASLTVPPASIAYVPAGTTVPLDEDEFDPHGWHDDAGASPYIVVPEAGDYLLHARWEWSTVGATDPQSGAGRQLRIRVARSGGGGIGARSLMAPQQMGTVPGMSQEVAVHLHLLADDWVYMTVAHDANGNMTYDSADERNPRLTVVRLDGGASSGGGGGGAEVTITTDASLTATESPANTFALAARLSPDAGNALALRGNGLYATDTGEGGGGSGNTTMHTQTATPTGATNSLWFNPSESA